MNTSDHFVHLHRRGMIPAIPSLAEMLQMEVRPIPSTEQSSKHKASKHDPKTKVCKTCGAEKMRSEFALLNTGSKVCNKRRKPVCIQCEAGHEA